MNKKKNELCNSFFLFGNYQEPPPPPPDPPPDEPPELPEELEDIEELADDTSFISYKDTIKY